jgi:hypothetical protein
MSKVEMKTVILSQAPKFGSDSTIVATKVVIANLKGRFVSMTNQPNEAPCCINNQDPINDNIKKEQVPTTVFDLFHGRGVLPYNGPKRPANPSIIRKNRDNLQHTT